jgi:DNA-binding transcriptional ArsR family regulator
VVLTASAEDREGRKGTHRRGGHVVVVEHLLEAVVSKRQPRHATVRLHNRAMDADLDQVFKALADPGRRLLLDRLHAENGQTLGQLCARMEMTRQAVTKHLKVLEEASLVVPIWRGREKLHYLNPVPIYEISERWIGKFERGRLRVLAELKKKLEGEPDG